MARIRSEVKHQEYDIYIFSGEKVLLRKIKSKNVSLKKGLPTFVSPMKGAGSLDYNLQFWANTNHICCFVESIWLVTVNLLLSL